MTPDERELRRALNSRSAEVSPAFRARLWSALAEGKPASNFLPALAAVAAVVLVFATVGVLLLARQARNAPPVGPATTPGVSLTPTPEPIRVPGVLNKAPRLILPGSAQLSAATNGVVWVLVEGKYLYRSTDRGTTWQQRPMPPQQMPRPEISFVSDAEGWLTTGGSPETQCNAESVAVWHTTDGGLTWQSLGSNGIGAAQCKEELSFVDTNRGFLDSFDPNHAPIVYLTTDGGRTWAASNPLPDPPGFTTQAGGFTLQPGLVSAFGTILLISASMNNSAGDDKFVFESTDGGKTWTYVASAKDPNNQVDFVTAKRWLQLIAPGQSVETTDAGASWHGYASDYSQAAPIAAEFDFGDSLVGYGTVRGEINTTVDGGLHWVRIKSPGT